jgi:hypothetical protein
MGGALALALMAPAAVSAQQRTPQPSQPPQAASEGVSTAKVLAIGTGAVLGVIAAQAIVIGDGVALVGGVVGGVAAAWWYDSASESGPTRASLRQPAALPTSASGDRVALAE